MKQEVASITRGAQCWVVILRRPDGSQMMETFDIAMFPDEIGVFKYYQEKEQDDGR